MATNEKWSSLPVAAWGFGLAALVVGLSAVPLGVVVGPPGVNVGAASGPGVPVPGWVFGAVWTVLYPTLGFAVWRLWRQRERPGALEALAALAVAFVTLWAFMPVASAAHDLRVTAMMDVMSLVTVWTSAWAVRRVDQIAGWWLLPLQAWMPLTTLLKVWVLRVTS
jgi:translocator protein